MNIAKARFNMVQQQIRPWDVLDNRVLDAMTNIPREKFVPSNYQDLAFADTEIPLGHGQIMLTPKLIARSLQALQLTIGDSVLEIGTGSGYLTALLAELSSKVTSIEINQELISIAEKNLKFLPSANLNLIWGDALTDLHLTSTFDAIILTGSLPFLPDSFKNLLNINGRLIAVTGSAPIMQATITTRNDKESYTEKVLFETFIPPLINAPTIDPFEF
jgi:protein-L-isoaspartate(D-aspartate) O-methyltransferase